MISPDAINGFVAGALGGFGAAIACIKFMIRGALNSFELMLIDKYELIARRSER